MFIRSILLVSLMFTTAVQAQEEVSTSSGSSTTVGSEYLHQAPAGAFELTPGLIIQSTKVTVKNSTNKSDTTNVPFTVKGEYGFNDMFSVSAQLGLGIGATDNSCTSPAVCDDSVATGMIDPVVSANMRIPVGIAALRFGVDVSTALSERKIEKDGDSNFASGGTVIAPYAGAEFIIGQSVFGARVSYDLYKGDRDVNDETTTPASTYKTTDEQELDVNLFYEFNFPRVVSIGAALEYTDSPTSKTESNGVKTSDNNAATITQIKVYVPLRFNPRVTLVPVIAGGVVDYKSSASTVKEQTISTLGVIARFTF